MKALASSADVRSSVFSRSVFPFLAALAAALLAVTGCADRQATMPEVAAAPVAQAAEPTPVATPAASPTSLPTATPAPSATPTLTPTPTHPLMIEVMRQQEYPGSEITFEEVLQPGANYNRYIVSYQSEGNKIYGLLTIPWGDRPLTGWPVIIFNHGYIPPDVYRTTERYVAYVDGFARHGYIVFKPDYRGHGSSEGEASGGYGSPAYTVDVLNALAAIRAYPDADPDRVGMWGHSMGGHITLRAMVVSDDIKAGVIWAGVVASYPDLMYNWRRSDGRPTPTPDPIRPRGRWRQQLVDTYGSPEENPAFWAAISPITYVSDLSGPVQIHHGTNDSSVPVAFSESLYAAIQAVGLPVEFYLYEGSDHNISQGFDLAMQRSIEFFDVHVKGAG